MEIEVYRQWERRRQAFFDQTRQVAEQAGLSEREAESLAQPAVVAVRSQRDRGEVARG